MRYGKGEGYRAMISNYFVPKLEDMDVKNLYFQQDGATSHAAVITIDLMKKTSGERLIFRNERINWPQRLCDLTPLEYFCWGYVKSLAYADKPTTSNDLDANIECVLAELWPKMLEKVVENWTSRICHIRASRSGHMPKVIFKK